MKIKFIVITVLLSLLAVFSIAQEGHPLKGTWRGTITMDEDNQPLLMIMDYDGNNITGMINPGRSSYLFSNAALDAPSWTLVASATTRDGTEISFEAILNEVGASNRYLEGTWTQAGTSYPFRITRE